MALLMMLMLLVQQPYCIQARAMLPHNSLLWHHDQRLLPRPITRHALLILGMLIVWSASRCTVFTRIPLMAFRACKDAALLEISMRIPSLSVLSSLLAVAGTTVAAPIHDELIRGDEQAVLAMLAETDVDLRDARGRTPLHYAALLGRKNAVDALINAGADVNAVDALGETPLHLAARRTQVYQVQQLLRAGARADELNRNGASPILLLTEETAHEHELDDRATAIAALLIRAGADANRLDPEGYSLRDQAHLAHYHALEDAAALFGVAWSTGSQPLNHVARSYRSYADIEAILQQAEIDFPTLAQGHVLGQSGLGRNISAINITSNVGVAADKPRVKFVSTMHGDETVGNEMMLYLIDYLLTNYGSNARVTNIVDNIDLWIVPLMNPDGYDRTNPTRGNSNNADLNRDFPDQFDDPVNTAAGREPETAVILNWVQSSDFTLSANIHTGALVVNYPLDSNPQNTSTFSPSDDEDVFSYISLQYALNNLPMYNSPTFTNGITNGADWYSIRGGMQDWNYVWEGCMEVTLELSTNKNPASAQIPLLWNDNRDALLAYIEQALTGVRGTVSGNGAPVAAHVEVVGRNFRTNAYNNGIANYHRILRPGTYDMRFEAPGFDPVIIQGVAVNAGDATRMNISLPTAPSILSPNGGEVLALNNSNDITWTGSANAWFDVELTTNYGSTLSTSDSFESGAIPSEYSFAGSANWVTTTTQAATGSRSIMNANIGDSQTAVVRRTIEGPGTVAFKYRTSTEANYDFLNFKVNGTTQLSQSGSTGWLSYSTSLPAGTHTLEWEYFKDGSVSNGADTVYVDDIELTSVSESWTSLGTTAIGASSFTFTPSEITNAARVRIRANYPGGIVGAWTESADDFSIDEVDTPCPSDLDGTGTTDITDLLQLLAAFNTNSSNGDVNGDGMTDISDLLQLLAVFNTPCP